MSTVIQPGDDNASYELVDVPENEQGNELDSVLSELGVESMEDIMLKVYRINDMGREAHCFDCLPEAINGIEDRLRDSYGKGDYKIKVFAATSSGGKAVKKHIKLSIETPIEKERLTVDNSGDDLKIIVSTMMETMQQSQINMMQMFKEQQLESQNKTQELMITVLGNNKNDNQPTLLETMAALKELSPVTKDPMEVFGQMLTMNREIKAEMTPEAPAAEGSISQLMDGANKLIDLAANAPKAAQRPQQAPQHEKPHPQKQLEKPPESNDMNALLQMKLKHNLNVLNSKASDGSNPSLWADVTIDEIPEQYYPNLIEAIGENDEQGFNNLLSINSVIEGNKEWFIEFIHEIRLSFFPENETETESELTDDTVLGDDKETSNTQELETTDNVDTETTNIQSPNENNT